MDFNQHSVSIKKISPAAFSDQYFCGMEANFPHQTHFYKGKVRDVYTIADNWIVMFTSNRLSAFDVVLPKTIPSKGQMLNQMAAFMLHQVQDIVPVWLTGVPAPQVSVGRRCNPFKIEMVVRGNLCGHAWRSYRSGLRTLCGVAMQDGLKENDFFAEPIITPTTKASEGHDTDISAEDIIRRGLVSEADWHSLKQYALRLFQRGRAIAERQGLILADTKYEFGKIDDRIYLMDEIHTPDSSRYFYADGFSERQQKGEKQKQLSKEFVREWLLENNFCGLEGQTIPEMTDQTVEDISKRYIGLYEIITGQGFMPMDFSDEEVYEKTLLFLEANRII